MKRFYALVVVALLVIIYPNIGWIRVLLDNRMVSPSYQFSTAQTEQGAPYEHCVAKPDSGAAYLSQIGTPEPTEPVTMNNLPLEIPVPALPVPELIEPTLVPVPTPTPIPFNPEVEVVRTGAENPKNLQIVFVGIGYGDATESKLIGLIEKVSGNFQGVRVDFAYDRNSVDIALGHINQKVFFIDKNQYITLVKKIKSQHKVDGIILVINSADFLGEADINIGGPSLGYVSAENSGSVLSVSHEIAHMLGLNDGYNQLIPTSIPGSELFYSDLVPEFVSRAVHEIGSIPPLYTAGTCNGKQLYTFYENLNNIMGNYDPKHPNSWGDSLFTPLQIQIMNDFVNNMKGN